MGSEWRDCVVSLMDLVGVRAQAKEAKASTQMRKLHRALLEAVGARKYSFARAYAYNDAVLLLSYVEDKESLQTVMREVDELKKSLDKIGKSYAIAVKGQAFPAIRKTPVDERIVIIETSSWAMANCFEIEKQLRRLRKSWYVDERIAKHLSTDASSQTHQLAMYPTGRRRGVYVYSGYLWP